MPIITKQESLGYLFGDSISSLNPDLKPKLSDVVRLWIYHYDGLRGESFFFPQKQKNIVVSYVKDDIISLPVWKSESPVVWKDTTVRNYLVKLVNRAESFGTTHFQEKAKKNPVWFKEVNAEFDQVFDITRTSLSDFQTPQKRKSDELNEQVRHL